MSDERAARRWALVVTVVAGISFALVALVWVPWHPVPGGAPAPVAPESVFTPEQIARAEDYASWSRLWSLLSLAVGLVAVSVLGFTRWGARQTARLRGPWWLRVVLGVVLVNVVGLLLTLPCRVMLQRHRLANDLSNQPWSGYVRDVATSEAIGVLATSVALLVLMGAARRWTRAWPAIAAAALGTLVVLTSFVYPVVVEPLFNDFVPLEEGQLRSAIFELAVEQGVGLDDVLVADASRRTTTLNAYVSGFGSTRRVVVYDTLVESLTPEETLTVVSHELAHAANFDVVIGTALGALGAAVGVGLLGLALTRRGRWPSIANPRVVPVVLALTFWATLVISPIQSGISRQIETRADVEALSVTREPAAFVEMQRTLAMRSLADPTPPVWIRLWWGSHPTTLERIALAESR